MQVYCWADYDGDDALEHLRCQAADWADACGVAIGILEAKMAGDDDNDDWILVGEADGRETKDRSINYCLSCGVMV